MRPADPADPAVVEDPVRFSCEGDTLVGVLARPAGGMPRIAVVIVVGGPQYRAGSQRQFVLLARGLAQAGWPALRFDHRGIGDSSGEPRSFEAIGDDIRAAIDEVRRRLPDIDGVVLWGLCDAASAAMIYAPCDPRVVGLVLANPWARAAQTYAKARLRHYYLQRVLSAEFWRRLVSGRLRVGRSMRDLAGSVGQAMQGKPGTQDYRHRMLEGLRAFAGPVLWLFSGRDLTAREFLAFLQQEGAAGCLAGRNARRIDLPEADHTFAHPDWRATVESATIQCLQTCWSPERSRPGAH